MTIKQALIWATKKLEPLKRAGHYDTPALDAEILLSFTIEKSKEFLYAHPEKKLTAGQWIKFKKLITRRAKHEPVAYITSLKEFYGLDFFVDKNVLIPRPETELLVEQILKIAEQPPHPTLSPSGRGEVRGNQSLMIVDVGTGSGCIIISLTKKLPNYLITKLPVQFFATEISSGAIKVAQKNIKHHKVAVTLLRGNLLMPFLKNLKSEILNLKSLIVVANLPYLTTKQWRHTQPEIKKYEPQQALDGGPDGLKYYRLLFKQISALLAGRSPFALSVFLEIDPAETKRITKIIKHHFPAAKIEIKKDLANRDRVVIIHIENNKFL